MTAVVGVVVTTSVGVVLVVVGMVVEAVSIGEAGNDNTGGEKDVKLLANYFHCFYACVRLVD